MGFLLLSIISSTFITLIFKLITRRKIDIFSSIVVNYQVACLLGFAFANFSGGFFLSQKLVAAAVIVGILFISTFYLIGYCTSKVGMGTTTVASKMSLAIPVSISFLIDPSDNFTLTKALVLALAVIAVALATYQKNSSTNKKDLAGLFLPILVFVMMGLTDSMVKVAQQLVIPDGYSSNFTALVFGIAGLIGLAILLSKKGVQTLSSWQTWKWGALLGAANFGSLLFFLHALNSKIPSSTIFSVNNIGTVILSIAIGTLLFKEKLTMLNVAGVAASIICIICLSAI